METPTIACQIDANKKEIAKKRWKLLISVLTKKQCNVDKSISVRRFASFGLLNTAVLDIDTEVTTSKQGHTVERRHIWYRYTSIQHPEYEADIRHLDESLDISDVLGFNNTGNVCVWPSEEILTHYCLENKDLFRNKSVCELGGGMTCLAGVAVATCTEASDVLLTDGNINSVENLQIILQRNKDRFGKTDVSSSVLRWDQPEAELKARFDTVVCADCLFFDEYRSSLADVIHHLLKPQGRVVMFAPSRGKTFHAFIELLAPRFREMVHAEQHDVHVWALHRENLAKGVDSYDPNLHYPMKLTFCKE